MSLILRLQYCLSANGISTNLSQETICASSRLRNLAGQADDLENNKQILSGFSWLQKTYKNIYDHKTGAIMNSNTIYTYVEVISLTLEGMNAKTKSTARIPIGTRSSRNGGGGKGGSTNGRISNEAVRHTSKSNDSRVK